jgi:hypothetical protein
MGNSIIVGGCVGTTFTAACQRNRHGHIPPSTASAEMEATNIVADPGYADTIEKPAADIKSFYVLDSAGRGLFMSLGPQSCLNVQLNVPGPCGHWTEVITEKYQMWQLQSGRY